eukprot:COSAG06_NODE_38_length_30373_cov_182.543536_4_plen_155_part_00
MPTGKAGDTSSAAQLAFTSTTARAQVAEAQVVGRPMALGPQVSPSCVQHTPCANAKALCSSGRLDASVVPQGSSGPPPPPPLVSSGSGSTAPPVLSGSVSAAAESTRARTRAQAFIIMGIWTGTGTAGRRWDEPPPTTMEHAWPFCGRYTDAVA